MIYTMNKKDLSEADIEAKYITPALIKSGWDKHTQISRQKYFTDGRIYVKGKVTTRGEGKRADYILFYKPNIPIAVIESKDNKHSVKAGIQQALDYSHILDIPFVFSSNGDAFYFHDKTSKDSQIERELSLDDSRTPETLWRKHQAYKGAKNQTERVDLLQNIIDKINIVFEGKLGEGDEEIVEAIHNYFTNADNKQLKQQAKTIRKKRLHQAYSPKSLKKPQWTATTTKPKSSPNSLRIKSSL